jgi:hypothetical protein
VWPSVALFFLQYRVEPVLFYQSQIEELRLAPPQLLNTQLALDRYERLKTAAIADLPVYLSCQMNRFIQGLSSLKRIYPEEEELKLCSVTLINNSLSLSPLLRYCLAKGLDLPELAERFAEDAKLQLLPFVDAYREHWHTVLPVDYVEEVEAQRRAALCSSL